MSSLNAGDVCLPVVAYRNCLDRVPDRHFVTWSKLQARLLRHEARDKKDGAAWSPALYPKGATRSNTQIESLSCFVADIDDGTPPASLRERWVTPGGEPLAFALHSSYSSTLALPKYRVVFPLTAPVPASEWPDLYRTLTLALTGGRMAWIESGGRLMLRAVGCPADPACKDPARLYYLPACPPDALEVAFADAGNGAALDPYAFPAAVLPPCPKPNRPARPALALEGERPGDDFNLRGDAAEILLNAGWSFSHRSGGAVYLRRPGKTHGYSGSVGCGSNSFYCFTSSAPPFEANAAYTPFAVYALLRCGGDFRAATKALCSAGYGTKK